jgi:hypothetical protein
MVRRVKIGSRCAGSSGHGVLMRRHIGVNTDAPTIRDANAHPPYPPQRSTQQAEAEPA